MEKRFSGLFRYELFVSAGVILTLAAALKLSGMYNFSSDWFWVIIGLALTIDGIISLKKQRLFERKFKIVEKKS